MCSKKDCGGFQYDYTIDDVHKLREQGFGMHEAKRMLQKDCLIQAIKDIPCVDECKTCKFIMVEILKLIN